jgi:hypothetical protein
VNKFKYLLFPEHTYILTFDDFRGKPFSVEVSGGEILAKLRREYALERVLQDLEEINIDKIESEWDNNSYE